GVPATSAATVAAYACAPPIAPDAAAATNEIQTSYANWKSAYLTASGAGGNLRVLTPDYGADSVSEGIGYGMLMAVTLNDRPTFDGLWAYARSHLDQYGLMNWRIGADGSVVGANSATDADEDMAFALVLADKTRGWGYTADARALIGNIIAHEVEANTWVLKPTDVWGGSNITNPSYYATGYYRAFGEYTGDTRWDGVINAAYGVIAAVNAVNPAANATGLLPDWTTAQGGPTSMSYQYTYDATRIPWRLAQDAVWHCDARASAQLNKISAFFKHIGPGNILDGYKLDGTVIGQYHNAAFVGTAAAGSIVSPDAAYKTAMWNETVRLHDGTYYNDSLRLLTILFMSGGVPDPFGPNPAPTSTTIADFESGQPGNWTANPGPSSTASASIAAPGYNSNYALAFNYTIGANGSAEVDDFLTSTQGWAAHDWSKYQAISFAFKGNGTPATYQLQLLGQAGQTAGRSTYQFPDSSATWHTITVPFSAFSPAPSLSQVFGWAFVPQTAGSGSFTLDQLTLHTEAPATFAFPGGSVTRQPQPNNMVTLTATPAANYRFAGWTQDGVDTGNSGAALTVPMQDDHSVVTRFLPIAYALNVTATAGGSAQVSPATGPYYYGTAVTLWAIATSGYRFAGWTVNGANDGAANPLNLTVTGDQAIVANFAPLPPPGGITLVPATGGTAAVQSAGATATITATPSAGYLFTGWTVDGQFVGWPNPLTLPLNTNHDVAPTFAVYFNFPDVSRSDPNYAAIIQLSARRIIRGYQNGNFGPADMTMRAQMAAMIVRALGWESEQPSNPFPDQGPIDPALWNDVAILAAHGVAHGYGDGSFRPTVDVLHAQTISFITRAMVAQGYWQPATSDDPTIYPNVPLSSGHRLDLVTFVRNAGPIPDRPANQPWTDWNTSASRGWFARVFWQALDSYFGR
ncbi:MAG: glycosyl hydrolase family 8, partial [Thermomicrobiales bacterium]